MSNDYYWYIGAIRDKRYLEALEAAVYDGKPDRALADCGTEAPKIAIELHGLPDVTKRRVLSTCARKMLPMKDKIGAPPNLGFNYIDTELQAATEDEDWVFVCSLRNETENLQLYWFKEWDCATLMTASGRMVQVTYEYEHGRGASGHLTIISANELDDHGGFASVTTDCLAAACIKQWLGLDAFRQIVSSANPKLNIWPVEQHWQ